MEHRRPTPIGSDARSPSRSTQGETHSACLSAMQPLGPTPLRPTSSSVSTGFEASARASETADSAEAERNPTACYKKCASPTGRMGTGEYGSRAMCN
eukprot:6197433-Pleurochrysis_carterae.AAC.2